jgi:hypothetical protein
VFKNHLRITQKLKPALFSSANKFKQEAQEDPAWSSGHLAPSLLLVKLGS